MENSCCQTEIQWLEQLTDTQKGMGSTPMGDLERFQCSNMFGTKVIQCIYKFSVFQSTQYQLVCYGPMKNKEL